MPRFTLRQLFFFLPGLFLAILSGTIRFKAFSQTSYVTGWDGYFYLVQLKSLVEEGFMHTKDLSLIYPFLKLSLWFCDDYALSFKITTALIAGGVTLMMYLLAKRWSGSVYIALLIGSISLFSPHMTYFAAQYPKNLLGFLFFLMFLFSLSGSKGWKASILLVLNYFGHKLTFGSSLIFSFLLILFKKISLKLLGIFLIGSFIILILSILIPGLPNMTDLERFRGVFTFQPQFSTYSFITEFGANDRISLFWMAELVLATAIYILSFPFIRSIEKKALGWSLFGVCTILMFPFLKWSFTGMSYRFFLVFVLISPLFISLLIDRATAFRQRIILLLITVALMIGSIFSYKSYHPDLHDPNYRKYEEVTRKSEKFLQSHSPELIISHNGLAEYFTFTTGIDAMPWLPEYAIEKDRLWRIASGLRTVELAYFLEEEEMQAVHRLSLKYHLLPEDIWQKLVFKAKSENDTVLMHKIESWQNPYKIRPDYLLKKKE